MTTVSHDIGFVGRVFLQSGDGLFGTAFLGDTDNGIEDQNGKNLQVEGYAVRDEIKPLSQLCRRYTGCGSTYNGGIDKCTPAAFIFEQGEDEGNGGRAKQDNNKLIFELL